MSFDIEIRMFSSDISRLRVSGGLTFLLYFVNFTQKRPVARGKVWTTIHRTRRCIGIVISVRGVVLRNA